MQRNRGRGSRNRHDWHGQDRGIIDNGLHFSYDRGARRQVPLAKCEYSSKGQAEVQEMKSIVTFGEIMLRLTPPNHLRFTQARSFDALYGGGESNVAVALANFALPAEYVTRLPANDLGDACLNYLRQFGVGTRHIARGGDRLGIYYLEMGAAQRASKVIYDRAGSS